MSMTALPNSAFSVQTRGRRLPPGPGSRAGRLLTDRPTRPPSSRSATPRSSAWNFSGCLARSSDRSWRCPCRRCPIGPTIRKSRGGTPSRIP